MKIPILICYVVLLALVIWADTHWKFLMKGDRTRRPWWVRRPVVVVYLPLWFIAWAVVSLMDSGRAIWGAVAENTEDALDTFRDSWE